MSSSDVSYYIVVLVLVKLRLRCKKQEDHLVVPKLVEEQHPIHQHPLEEKLDLRFRKKFIFTFVKFMSYIYVNVLIKI